jgi:hypothetical protein
VEGEVSRAHTGMGTIMGVVMAMGTPMPIMVDGEDMAAMVVDGAGLTSTELKWERGELPGELQLVVKGEPGGEGGGVGPDMSPTNCFV